MNGCIPITPIFIKNNYSKEDNIILHYPSGYPYYNYYIQGTLYKKKYITKTNMVYYLILINNTKNKYIYVVRIDNIPVSIEELKMFDMEIKTIEMLMNIKSLKK